MFDSLADKMKHDDATAASPGQRMTKWAVIALCAVFGAVYYALQAICLIPARRAIALLETDEIVLT
jgi:hypothetical protein